MADILPWSTTQALPQPRYNDYYCANLSGGRPQIPLCDSIGRQHNSAWANVNLAPQNWAVAVRVPPDHGDAVGLPGRLLNGNLASRLFRRGWQGPSDFARWSTMRSVTRFVLVVNPRGGNGLFVKEATHVF